MNLVGGGLRVTEQQLDNGACSLAMVFHFTQYKQPRPTWQQAGYLQGMDSIDGNRTRLRFGWKPLQNRRETNNKP